MFPALANPLEDLEPGSPKKKRNPSAMIQELFLPADTEGEARDALRHVVYDKVHLALQIAREQLATEGPTCGLLLSTAMEISQALDEPDLNAFTWLSSGFTNMQANFEEESSSKQKLALTQVMHSIELARENGFPYLLSLALHCAADLHFRVESYIGAKECLVEAARLTPGAVELAMKMQLHRKIHDLRECTKVDLVTRSTAAVAVLSEDLSRTKKARNAFSLWDHSVGAQFKHLLLHKVLKLSPPGVLQDSTGDARMRSGCCYIEIKQQERNDVPSPPPTQQTRARVFFDSLETVEWLRTEVLDRLRNRTVLFPQSDDEYTEETITGFWDREDFDPIRQQQRSSPQLQAQSQSPVALLPMWRHRAALFKGVTIINNSSSHRQRRQQHSPQSP